MVSRDSLSVEKIKVKSNFFQLKLGQTINRYKLEIFQDDKAIDPNASFELFIKSASIHRKELNSLFGSAHYRVSNIIYSPRIADEQSFHAEVDNKTIKTVIKPAGMVEIGENAEAMNFLGRLFKSMQSKLKLKKVNNKYFDDQNPTKYSNWKLELWAGYSTSLAIYNKIPLANIDVSFKVIREKTVAELINENKSKWMEGSGKLKEMIVGMTVMTTHSKILFRIDDIDLGKRPIDTFARPDGTVMTFLQYFKDKYNITLHEKSMPMLIQKKNRLNGKEEIHCFPPELCVLTGLSEEMKENRSLMKDLATTTKPNPTTRLQKCAELCKMMGTKDNVSSVMKEWDIQFNPEPVAIDAKKIEAGNMLLAKKSVPLERNPQLDRDSQHEMLEQPKLEDWVVFYPQRDERILENFLSTLEQSIKSYVYDAKKPRTVGISGRSIEAWLDGIDKNTNQSTRMAIFLLEGRKKAAPLYDDIKRYLITKRPIPSQIVLTSTANSERGLRSICNKILVQICAKVGGVPWGVDNLPFSKEPTMVVGIDVYHKMNSHKKSLLAFTCTVNSGFSKYWSTIRQHEEGQEVGIHLESAFIEAVKEYIRVNEKTPIRIIVYRDGVSAGQRQAVQAMEVSSLLRAVESLLKEGTLTKRPDIIFICSNKLVTAKFFGGDHMANPKTPLQNPLPGTIVDSNVTEGADFYLASQTVREGCVTPTHYFILGFYQDVDGGYVHSEDAMKKHMVELQILTFKLCYLYYNWTGAIKIPAPIHYADRLATLIGDRSQADAPIIPHSRFGRVKSLFFI